MAYSIPYEAFNEGKQAEEYLKRKMKEKEERDNEDNKYIYKGEVPGRRAAATDTPTGHDISHKRTMRDSDWNDGTTPESYDTSTKYDPKHKTAFEIEKHREKYGDVMPKNKTEKEKRLDKDRDRELYSRMYASRMVEKKANEYDPRSFKREDMEYRFGIESQRAHDAARRHYRRTHKHESAGIFESVEFI